MGGCGSYRRAAHQGLPRLDGADSPVVHLTSALVGAPAARLVPGRRNVRRRASLRARDGNRRRTSSTPGSPRRSGCMAPWGGLTLKPRIPGIFSDRRPCHGAGHHLLGRADDHDLARVHRRDPVLRRLRALRDPGPGRKADVQEPRYRDRPARRDRRAARMPCASGCSRCPRPRTCAFEARVQQGRTSRTRPGTPRA